MTGQSMRPAGRPRVLVLIGAMWPGNDSSGPNRSVRGLTEALGDRFDFRLLARSGPPGETAPSPAPGEWHDTGFAAIQYLPVGMAGARGLIGAIRDCEADALLMNSVWDPEFTLPVLAARRAGFLRRDPAVISTRGEFSSEALALKPLRKRFMRRALQASKALEGITLHATSDTERRDVASSFPDMPVFVAPNVRPVPTALPHEPASGSALRAVFIGRISRVKGLDTALGALAQCERQVGLSVYGPEEDRYYVEECRALADRLPAHATVSWKGVASADDIPRILAAADLLLMPSQSENFGHAIFEALAAGVPAMVGPNTPWQDLSDRKAGAVLPLDDLAAWAHTIDRFAEIFPLERTNWATGSRSVAEDYVAQGTAAALWEDALRALAAGRPPA